MCFHSSKLALFLSQVPEFMSVIKSPFFAAEYLPDRVLWLLLFAVHAQPPCTSEAIAYYHEACTYSQEFSCVCFACAL